MIPAELVNSSTGAGSALEFNAMSTRLRSPDTCFSKDFTVRLKSTFQAGVGKFSEREYRGLGLPTVVDNVRDRLLYLVDNVR